MLGPGDPIEQPFLDSPPRPGTSPVPCASAEGGREIENVDPELRLAEKSAHIGARNGARPLGMRKGGDGAPEGGQDRRRRERVAGSPRRVIAASQPPADPVEARHRPAGLLRDETRIASGDHANAG